ncbi:hypothetical protein [Micromonospora sp. NPDC003241]
MNRLNSQYHRPALLLFLVIVVAHWAEHLVQAFQIWGLGWTPAESRGVLGMPFPWLVTEEWMHYAYALIMLAGFIALRPGFTGTAKTWWTVALGIQVWHHFEHLLLLIQVQSGTTFFGQAGPVSIAQLIVPRVELHLFYNGIVFLPMVVAMFLHRRPGPDDADEMTCTCAPRELTGAGVS